MGYSGTTLNIVCWIFTGLATSIVGLRIFTRFRLAKSPGRDDAVIVWALILDIVSTAMYSWSVAAGTGKHFATLSPIEAVNVLKINVIASAIAIHGFSWPKLSVAMLLIRLLNPPRRTRIFFYIITGFLIMWTCFLTIFWFTQCRPAEAYWDPRVKGTCWPPSVITDMGFFVGCEWHLILQTRSVENRVKN